MPSGSPGELNRETRLILDALKRHGVKTQLWVMLDMGADPVAGEEQERRVELAAAKLRPLAEEAAKVGCSVALYNHGGWFGEPENQVAIIERLKRRASPTSASSTTCTTATTTSTASPTCSRR